MKRPPGRPVLVVADAPPGPHPSLYLPALLAEFEVHAVYLDVERGEARERRVAALAPARTVRPVADPGAVEAAVAALAAECRADGVVAFSERVVHAAQAAAGALGLPANGPEARHALQDKRVQRALLRVAGLPTPAVRMLPGPAEVSAAAREFPFPAVLKPAIGMGSLGTFPVRGGADLADTWSASRRLVDADPRVAHRAPVLMLEEELAGDPAAARDGVGDQVSVEAIVDSGRVHVLAVSDKLPLSHPYRETGHLLPSLRPASELEPVLAQVVAAHRALGVTFGATHTEVKLTPDGPRIIEVNGRVGGSVPERLRLAAGYDLTTQLARLATGQPVDPSIAFHRWAAYLTPQPPTGRHQVRRAPTWQQVESAPGVVRLLHLTPAGAVVDSDAGTAGTLLRAVAVADDPHALIRLGERLGADHFAFKSIHSGYEEPWSADPHQFHGRPLRESA